MRRFALIVGILSLFPSLTAYAYVIEGIQVGKGKDLELTFQYNASVKPMPSYLLKDSVLRIQFANAQIGEQLKAQEGLMRPHALVQEISWSQRADNLALVEIHLNGETQGLQESIRWARAEKGVELTVPYPKTPTETLKMLEAEQSPLRSDVPQGTVQSSPGWQGIVGILFLVLLAVAGTLFFFRYLRNRSVTQGTRKYLIERLSYCALGQKSGVSLLKIGGEFVLVGVTPQQITMLSKLESLESEYSKEAKFERQNFQRVVQEELKTLKTEPLSA